jgi:hypothetical protein
MENVTVPDGLPTLASGAHQPGEGKACVMEYISLLAGEDWTDLPECTHPLLAVMAQTVNDWIKDDSERAAALVPLIGRLFGANQHTPEVHEAFLRVLRPFASPSAIIEARTLFGSPNGGGYGLRPIARSILYAYSGADIPRVALRLLTDLLDAYDEATGRTVREVPAATLADLSRQVLAGATA